MTEAIRAYTWGSAYAVNEENNKGTLRARQLADFVLRSEDVFSIDPTHIRDTTVAATIVGGEIVYDDGILTSADRPAPVGAGSH